MPPCALIWIWVTVTSGRHPMPARGCFMFWGFFKFALAAICVGLFAPLAVACGGGEDGPPPTPFTGDWILEDETDPITDEGFISISLEASDNDVSGVYAPQMIVQCHDAKTFNVYIVWGKTLTASERPPFGLGGWIYNQDGTLRSYVDIAWRVDDDEAQTDIWILADEVRTFAPPSAWYDTPAVDDLRKADKISVRVFSKNGGNQATAVFHPSGFEDAFQPIISACK